MPLRRLAALGPVARALLVLAVCSFSVLAIHLSRATAAGDKVIVLKADVLPTDGYPNGRYLYMPFDVPEGVNRIAVKIDKPNPEQNKIGAVLYDERGAGYQDNGFRGLYGEERNELFVSATEASTSFSPGRIKAGKWTVSVPVFRTGPVPFTVTATVTMSFGEQPEEAQLGEEQGVIDAKAGWYRGDLHVHTNESSDAFASQKAFESREYGAKARAAGLDWVSLTDHNVTKQNRTLKRDHDASGTLVIGGEEMTNFFHGHATVTGLKPGDHLDWRQRPGVVPLKENEARIQRFIEEVRKREVYTAVAHPYGAVLAWQFFSEPDRRASLPDGLEVWTGPFQPDDQASVEQWDELLKEGVRVFANGGSDVHGFNRGDGFALAEPTTVAYADQLSKAGIVGALKRGRSFVTRLSDGVELYLTARGPAGQRQAVGGTIYGGATDSADLSVLVRRGQGGRLVVIRDGEEVQVTPITAAEQTVDFRQAVGPRGGYVRVELRRDPAVSPAGQPISSRLDMEALTNPIFLVNGAVPPEMQAEATPPPPQAGPRRPIDNAAQQSGIDAPTPGSAAVGGPSPSGESQEAREARLGAQAARACSARTALTVASARSRGRGLAFEFARIGPSRVDVDVFRHSAGNRILGDRLVARFRGRERSFRWSGRAARGRIVGDGSYSVRFRSRAPSSRLDVRRVALRRVRGRFRAASAFDRSEPCGAIESFKTQRPVFGGPTNKALDVAFRLAPSGGRVTIELLRGRRVVRRLPATDRRSGVTHRLRLPAAGLRRGEYRLRLTLRQGEPTTVRTLTARRI